jgi:hypothetical protein
MATDVVVLDACVLYSAQLRNCLLAWPRRIYFDQNGQTQFMKNGSLIYYPIAATSDEKTSR